MLFISLPFSKPSVKAQKEKPVDLPSAQVLAKEVESLRRQLDDSQLESEISKIIISRYQKFIEDGEAKSIAELRNLVKPLDHTVVEMKITIQDSFHPYVYEKHFIPAVQKSLDQIFSYRPATLPVNFWLSFEDMQKINAADDIDRAILLCSLLRALGCDNARVLITKKKEAMASFAFNNKRFVIDIARKSMLAYPEGDDQYLQIMRQVMYSFNDKEYEDLSEEG